MADLQKIFDADTHILRASESIVPYLYKDVLARLPELETFKSSVKTRRAGQVIEPPYHSWYRFTLAGGWGSGKPCHLGVAGPLKESSVCPSHSPI